MTPKQKAIELVDKFTPHAYGVWDKNGSKEEKYHSKQSALIAVDEIIHALEYKPTHNHEELCFYEEVKQEIEKL